MNRFILLITSLFFTASTYSQNLSTIIFSGGSTLTSFSFNTDQDIIIKITDDGKILEWGTDAGPGRYYYDPKKLQPYMGRVEYYGQEYDSVLRGKVRSIGTASLTYYGAYETTTKVGKLKSIGNLLIDYYDNYDDAAFKGKIKFAGNTLFSYYSSFENAAFAGKLRSVGSSTLTYYSSFDDKEVKGKIKSIGGFEYSWYASYDQYRGSLKTGSYTQNIGGVLYIIM